MEGTVGYSDPVLVNESTEQWLCTLHVRPHLFIYSKLILHQKPKNNTT